MNTSNCTVPTLKTRQTYIFKKHWLVSRNQNLARLEKSTNVTASSEIKINKTKQKYIYQIHQDYIDNSGIQKRGGTSNLG